jgi:hypothetical protein
MRDFERSRVLAAEAGQRRRITPRIRGDLLGRAQAGRNRQHHAVEEVPTGDPVQVRTFQFDFRCVRNQAALPNAASSSRESIA